jgi:protoheme IX farnesyltransferase
LFLFAVIFMWTPPHFWALALFVRSDYAKAGIPMMPVVAGEAATRRQILAYAAILFAVSLAPWWIGGAGVIYGAAALVLSGLFVALSLPVAFRLAGEGDRMKPEKRLFTYSVFYLFALFTVLVVDRMMLA